jgi:Cobalamin adenosyltransferase
MSIATKRGDGGQTGLAGGIRVSKTHPRVECYGTIDELISQMGFARSICQDAEVRERLEKIQRELYKVGSAIATPPESKKTPPDITPGRAGGLVPSGRFTRLCSVGCGTHGMPQGGALGNRPDGVRSDSEPVHSGVSQSPLRCALAIRKAG